MASRTELEATAVALGLDKAKAKRYSAENLERYIKTAQETEVNRQGQSNPGIGADEEQSSADGEQGGQDQSSSGQDQNSLPEGYIVLVTQGGDEHYWTTIQNQQLVTVDGQVIPPGAIQSAVLYPINDGSVLLTDDSEYWVELTSPTKLMLHRPDSMWNRQWLPPQTNHSSRPYHATQEAADGRLRRDIVKATKILPYGAELVSQVTGDTRRFVTSTLRASESPWISFSEVPEGETGFLGFAFSPENYSRSDWADQIHSKVDVMAAMPHVYLVDLAPQAAEQQSSIEAFSDIKNQIIDAFLESKTKKEAEQREEGLMPKSRKTTEDMLLPDIAKKRETASTEQLQKLIEESMGESDKLFGAVERTLLKHRSKFSQVMGIEEEFKKLALSAIDDIEAALVASQIQIDRKLKEIESKVTTKVEFKIADLPKITIKDPHFQLNDLLLNIANRVNTMMVGPSGSGKTHSVKACAEILKRRYTYIPMAPRQSEVVFKGFTDATSTHNATDFYLAYKYGWLLCLDEVDAGDRSALIWINGAVQNREASFPIGHMSLVERKLREELGLETPDDALGGGLTEAHEDFVCVATANTFGKGADLIYQGRNPLDGATLKRFRVIYWDYDEALERKLAGNNLWVDFVQGVRRGVKLMNAPIIVSPVDSIEGAKLLAAGKSFDKVAMETVFAGVSDDDVRQIITMAMEGGQLKDGTRLSPVDLPKIRGELHETYPG